ncbi:MAG: serine hydrolase, partial [Pseudomonadota bacterium]
GDRVLLALGYGVDADGSPFTADTPCGIYSATKALTAFTLAALVEDERVDVDAPLGAVLNDAPEDWRAIPFWRLLNHTSGITTIIDKPVFERLADDPTAGNAAVYDIVRTLPTDYAPGAYSRYRQSGYAVAEMILEERLGAPWPEIVARTLTEPAGATQTVHTDYARGKKETAFLTSAGGYETTAADAAQLFRALNAGSAASPAFLEDMLYKDDYRFGDYSLGAILIDYGDVRSVGHQGGGRANLRYAPRRGVGVFVCTDDRSNNAVFVDAADMLMRETAAGEATAPPVQMALYPLEEKPAAAIIAAYEDARDGGAYDMRAGERTINAIGYRLLGQDRLADATALFDFNVREHPTSANAYDSLGEAAVAAGDLARARANYERSLALDPQNTNAERMLEKINIAADRDR